MSRVISAVTITGEGLREALTGAQVVVDVAAALADVALGTHTAVDMPKAPWRQGLLFKSLGSSDFGIGRIVQLEDRAINALGIRIVDDELVDGV